MTEGYVARSLILWLDDLERWVYRGKVPTLAVGAAVLLWARAYDRNGTLPTDPDTLAEWSNLTRKEWDRIAPFLTASWELDPAGCYVVRRVREQLGFVESKRLEGLKGAHDRWHQALASPSCPFCSPPYRPHDGPPLGPHWVPNGTLMPPSLPKPTQATDKSSELPGVAEPSEPPVLVFPTVGKGPKSWDLTRPALQELAAAYPGIDTLAQARAALSWAKANPSRRKTATGMPRFLDGWMRRQQDRGTNGAAKPPEPHYPIKVWRDKVMDEIDEQRRKESAHGSAH